LKSKLKKLKTNILTYTCLL